jgi:hypothetical protein
MSGCKRIERELEAESSREFAVLVVVVTGRVEL